jgi:hypothetical protein
VVEIAAESEWSFRQSTREASGPWAILAEGIEDARALGGKNLVGGPLGEDAALFEADDFGVELEGLFDVVGYGKDGDVVVGGPSAHGGEEIVAEGPAYARKWFI